MVEHISAADAKPPNGPDDGVGLALADAGWPVEEDDGVPAAADPQRHRLFPRESKGLDHFGCVVCLNDQAR